MQPVYQAAPSSVPTPAIVRTQGQELSQAGIDQYMRQLRDPDEQVRADTVVQLGHLKALASVDPLAATLAGDRSPMVREAAARALGLIGSPKALPALQRAASADPDRDVRHSAQFAIDIVQSRP
jgi:HEAT repeat protein